MVQQVVPEAQQDLQVQIVVHLVVAVVIRAQLL
jgi:hypothetical protein